MKKSFTYADLKAAIEKDPKAYAASAGVATVGSIAVVSYASALTTTSIINGVVTTAKAGVISKAVCATAGIAVVAVASYYVYNKLKK